VNLAVDDVLPTLSEIKNELNALKKQVQDVEIDVGELRQPHLHKEKTSLASSTWDKTVGLPAVSLASQQDGTHSDFAGVSCFFSIDDGKTDGKAAFEREMTNPLLGNFDEVDTSQTWLKVVATVRREQDKSTKDKNITMTIANVELRDCIKTLLGPYIEHFSKSAWDKSEVLLSKHWNEILFNWRKFTTPNSGAVRSTIDTKFRHRLDIILRFVRAYYPGMVKIQDEWSGCSQVLWADIRVLFRPGSLIVAKDWSKRNSAGTSKSVQVFKVNHLAIKESGFIFTAWLWDWDGSQLVRTVYEFKIDDFRGQRAITDLPFYPIDFFVNEKGEVGETAVRSCQQYRDRRKLFTDFTQKQGSSRGILTYNGEVFGLRGGCEPASGYESLESFQMFRSEHLSQRLIDVSQPRPEA
jgi:hypothetical protein